MGVGSARPWRTVPLIKNIVGQSVLYIREAAREINGERETVGLLLIDGVTITVDYNRIGDVACFLRERGNSVTDVLMIDNCKDVDFSFLDDEGHDVNAHMEAIMNGALNRHGISVALHGSQVFFPY